MKIRLYDRLLIAFTGMCLVVAGVFGVLMGIGLMAQHLMTAVFGAEIRLVCRVIVVLISVVAILLGLHEISLLVRPKKDKGFVVQKTEYGDMSVSLKALENMVRKCIDSHEELAAQHIEIDKAESGIKISLKVLVSSGNSIPAVVDSLQKQIKQYVSTCAGVEVVQVSVMVEADPDRLAPPALMAPAKTEEERENAAPEIVQLMDQNAEIVQTVDAENQNEILEEEKIADEAAGQKAAESITEEDEEKKESDDYDEKSFAEGEETK